MQRVHHANYITYFELGRTELLRVNGLSYAQVEQDGLYLVVAEVNCRYLLPATYDEELLLRTKLISAKGAKIEHGYEIFRGLELLATGSTVIACVDRQGRVRRIPDSLKMPSG